jgi:hypothetical protein
VLGQQRGQRVEERVRLSGRLEQRIGQAGPNDAGAEVGPDRLRPQGIHPCWRTSQPRLLAPPLR